MKGGNNVSKVNVNISPQIIIWALNQTQEEKLDKQVA